MPGELHLTDLFGTSPGPATYPDGAVPECRRARRVQETSAGILRETSRASKADAKTAGDCERIQKSITVTLMILDSIRAARKES